MKSQNPLLALHGKCSLFLHAEDSQLALKFLIAMFQPFSDFVLEGGFIMETGRNCFKTSKVLLDKVFFPNCV